MKKPREARNNILRLRFSNSEVRALVELAKEAYSYDLIKKPEVTKFIRLCINYYGAHYIQVKTALANREKANQKKIEETVKLAEEARKLKAGPVAALIENVNASAALLQDVDHLGTADEVQSEVTFGTWMKNAQQEEEQQETEQQQ